MDEYINKIICGDALESLKTLPDKSVQCCVTSPPYWGLRDYGIDGQLGLEKTPEEYIARLVEIFAEMRRVLRDDGTVWLNLGDSYAGSGKGIGPDHGKAVFTDGEITKTDWRKSNLKPKDLVGIPWRVAFALQADGWYLRQDIIWSKPNPMPESVTDRCTKSHEYIFLLTKSAKYYYDAEAISEPCKVGYNGSQFDDERDLALRPATQRGHRKHDGTGLGSDGSKIRNHSGESMNRENGLRNKRSIWVITTQPQREAHFAVFPEEIPRICILSGSKKGDIVIDPFAGTNTTGRMAKKLGRAFIAIELNPKYIEIADRIYEREIGLLF
jgi:DNA modification methylase